MRFLARQGQPEPPGYRELALRPSNEFRGNDFSGAELIGVSFRGIDLAEQRLPTGDGYLYLPDAEAAISRALNMVGDRPEGPEVEKTGPSGGWWRPVSTDSAGSVGMPM